MGTPLLLHQYLPHFKTNHRVYLYRILTPSCLFFYQIEASRSVSNYLPLPRKPRRNDLEDLVRSSVTSRIVRELQHCAEADSSSER